MDDIEDRIEDTEETELWKKRPCHFTWDLKNAIDLRYQKIARNVRHDLEETPNLLRVEGLLFQAYLEVANFSKGDIKEARQALSKADEWITRMEEPLQNGYLSVALLNRMWIEKNACNRLEVRRLRGKFNRLRMNDGHDRVIGAIRATALSRLGPLEAPKALILFEAAVERFPDNPGFIFGAALMAGRQSRFEGEVRGFYKDMDYNGKRLMDKERDLFKKMMKVDDEYKLAQSNLGMNLCRREGIYPGIGLRHLEQAYKASPGVQEVCRNLARHYRISGQVDEAIRILQESIEQDDSSAQHHHQLALCFKSCAREQDKQRDDLLKKALDSVDKCLELDQSNAYAIFTKARVLTLLDRKYDAKNFYETLFQQHERLTLHDQIGFYCNYAMFLSGTRNTLACERAISLWDKVMETAELLEYQDEESGRWQVVGKAKGPKREAYKSLWLHYQRSPTVERQRQEMKLHYQNFEFQEAEELFLNMPQSVESLKYLALTYLKWGLENAAVARAELSQPEEAQECFMKARKRVLQAKELGLDVDESRKLLADVTLQIARNQLQLTPTSSVRGSNSEGQEDRRLESNIVEAYRQAVRCGSLTSSRELLNFLKSGKENHRTSSRWKWLQTLAEIDVCCSQAPSHCLQMESLGSWRHSRARSSFKYCQGVREDIEGIMAHEFFGKAWKSHFAMGKKILELFHTGNTEMTMDGRMEDPSTEEMSSTEIVTCAETCCKELRELLDRIMDHFEENELKISAGKKHYFPLILDEKDSSKIESRLQEQLQSYFGVDIAKHYPKLFKNLLQIQPGPESEADYLKDLIKLVNKVKHTNMDLGKTLKLVPKPVELARQCTDKVEEICNYFFDAIEESKHLAETYERLVSEIKGEERGKALELLELLKNNPDFIARMDCTWKLLEVLALIGDNLESNDRQTEEAHLTLAQGNFVPSQNLRQCHLDLEMSVLRSHGAQSPDVVKKCRDTCSEAKKMLDGALSTVKKKLRLAGRRSPKPVADTKDVSFPLPHVPNVDRSSWEGKVKKKLKTDLDNMGIQVPIKDKLLDILLKAQPCSSDDNYKFAAMFHFIDQPHTENVRVKIDTETGESREIAVLELTRWCTNNAERIAMELDALKTNLDNS